MTARATRVALRTDVVAKAGSSTLSILPDWLGVQWRRALTGDFGSAQLTLPADSLNAQYAQIGNVMRVTDLYPDAGVDVTDEYRITGLHDGAHLNTIEVTAAPISHDLGKHLVSQVIGGVTVYNLSVAFQTPAQIVTSFVLPALAAAGLTWIVAGTINGDPLTISWQKLTALGLLQLLATQTGLELQITRATNDANYTINLTAHTPVTDDTMPAAWVGRNVVALDRQIQSDQRFFTQIVVDGVTPDGEVETPGTEQAAFKVTTVAGDTLTITNPVSSYGPIGFDDQLNALTALTTIDPVPLHQSIADTRGMALDTSRNTIYLISQLPSSGGYRVYWHKLDDGTSGNFVPTASTELRGICYAPSSDRLYIADRNAGTVQVVNPATKTVVATISITGGAHPNRIRYVEGWDRVVVTHDSGLEVLNPNTNTRVGTLTVSTNCIVVYNAANSRVFLFDATSASWGYVTSALGAGASGAFPVGTSFRAAGTDGTTIYCLLDTGGVAPVVGVTINPSTLAVSASTAIAALGGVTLLPYNGSEIWYSATSGRLYAVSATAMYELSTAFVRTANVQINLPDANTRAWLFDATTDYLFLPDGDARHVKILQVPGLGAWQKATVASSGGSSRSSNQQFDRVAGSKGLTYAGQRVEFRQNSALDYRKLITDPAAIATYGPIDGVLPNTDNVGRRNYARAGSADEWRSDNVPKYLTVVDLGLSAAFEARWKSADETALTALAAQVAATYTSGAASIQVKGLGAGRVLSPGDILTKDAATPFGAGKYAVVIQRTVADGSGNATVPLWLGGIGSGMAINDPIYLSSPSITSLGQLPTADLIVLTPGDNAGIVTAYMAAPVPFITGMSTAWAVARVLVRSLSAAPNVVAFAAYGDGSGFGTHEVPIADNTAYADGLCREYVLAQRVDLSAGVTHVMTRLRTTSGGVVVYVKNLMVIQGAAAVIDRSIPFSGASMLWALGNRALQDAISPSITYQVQAVEDDTSSTNGLLTLGKEIRLRDPARGISATPRIIELTRSAVNREQQYRQPVLTLATRPASLVDSVVNLETS